MIKYVMFMFSIVLCSTNHLAASESLLIIVGPPGSGKGHLSQYLVKEHNYEHISAGDLLRFEVDQKSEIGSTIAPILARGEAVDPKIMRNLLKEKITKCSSSKLVVDGFGGQYSEDMSFLQNLLAENGLINNTIVIFCEAIDTVCATRMSSRLICHGCAAIFNTTYCPPQKEEQCDTCNNPLIRRVQDNAETIQKRLERYRKHMAPNYNQAHQLFSHCVTIDTNECHHNYDALMRLIEEMSHKVVQNNHKTPK